uniref:Fe2+ transport protein n=1 Tax=Musca domestica TaxID=7370 RepID=T1PIF0_MUSDO
MMSRTVRYFKLIYMAAGILMSNADICETVDSIQIAPRVEMKEKQQQQQLAKKKSRLAIEDKPSVEKKSANGSGGGGWLPKLSLTNMVDRIKTRIRPHLPDFSLWALPSYVIDFSTNLICRKFIINSDCDVIYK